MPNIKSLAERQADQKKERDKRTDLVRKIKENAVGSKAKVTKKKAPAALSSAPTPTPRERRSWAQVRADGEQLSYQARTTNDPIAMQPWTIGLVNALLSAADEGGNTLCLIWPAKVTSLSLLHALANLERVFAKDLHGLRTLMYPGTYACRAPLDGVLADRESLVTFYRKLWIQAEHGRHELEANTRSQAFEAALLALNDISVNHPEVSNPSLSELVPTIVFDPSKSQWGMTVSDPLERTLSKVERLTRRRDLRQKVGEEWRRLDETPGALMVLHHTAKKTGWKTALNAHALKKQGRPEVILLDATQAAARTNYTSVSRIPEFALFASENGFSDVGAVIVTDDPKSFFVLRKRFHDLRISLSTKVWAAEADDVLLSAHPVTADWQPAQRSNSNFSVSIVDRDASQIALTFQKLAAGAGGEESPAYQALIQACMYVLRLSNMPAGYTDLTAASAEVGEGDYGSQKNAWAPVKLALVAALGSGVLNEVRDSVERAIMRAEKLIDDWNDATPMAARMLAEIQKHAVTRRQAVALVLPNNKYIQLAHRFLQRKLGDEWPTAEVRVEWHTLSGVGRTLTGDQKGKHFTFVGINPDVLRILVTHPVIPHGTVVLVAYRQAESFLVTLTSMKDVSAFKAYRGRIGLLAQELERRMAEVPDPLVIGRLREMPMTFKFDERGHNGQSSEQAYYKFELEGDGRVYATGWIYRHVPDEDPPFRRAAASSIQPGDFIFDMSDELRAKLESSLQLDGGGVSSVVDPVRTLLKLYHDDVQRRCTLMFKSTKRSALAREIHAKMVELDPKAADCRPGRVYYWLALQAKSDTRPHASKDFRYFKVFCKALGISDEDADMNWGFVKNARRLSQDLGRELVARYAEILFQPESAAIYRKVPAEVIRHLQQEALRCVYRVERAVPPALQTAASKKGEKGAYPQ